MAVVLPILTLIALFLLFYINAQGDCRVSVIKASLVWAIINYGIIESLSFFQQINFSSALIAWSVVFLLTSVFVIRSFLLIRPVWSIPTLSNSEYLLLSAISLVVLSVGVSAFIFPPSTTDAMTYHLSRVMHWIQNESVNFYPTAILRQLHLAPGAEYILLTFQLLSGSDWLANSLQYAAYIGNILIVTMVTKELGGQRWAQIIAAVFTATLPAAILQGSSTQTDLVVSYWSIAFIFFSHRLISRPGIANAVFAGMSLGMALQTKALAYVYLAPFGIWLVFRLFRVDRRGALLLTSSILSLALLLNAAFFGRNYSLYGNVLGPGKETDASPYMNAVMSPATLYSNSLRNLGLQLGTPIPSINRFTSRAINKAHSLFGLDPSDSRTTWYDSRTNYLFEVIPSNNHEDSANNFWHTILVVIVLAGSLWTFRSRNQMTGYLVAIVSSYLVFSLLLRWQPWNGRLLLPYLVFLAPLVAIIMAQLSRTWIVNAVMVFLIALTASPLLNNQLKPLTVYYLSSAIQNRESFYFASRAENREGYIQAADQLALLNCKEVGLILSNDSYEYPLWQGLIRRSITDVQIDHVHVNNASGNLYTVSDKEEAYCGIFVAGEMLQPKIYVNEKAYYLYWQDEAGVGLYK